MDALLRAILDDDRAKVQELLTAIDRRTYAEPKKLLYDLALWWLDTRDVCREGAVTARLQLTASSRVKNQ
jgi:hypothetical protein